MQTYVFVPVRLEMSAGVFAVPNNVVYTPYTTEVYFHTHHRLLSPKVVPAILQSYTGYACEALISSLQDVPKRSGRIRLKNLLLPSAYVSGARALFGSKFNALDYFGAFQEFDQMFPLLTAGAPGFIVGRARKAWEQVVDSIEEHIKTPGNLEDAAEVVSATVSDWKDQGFVSRHWVLQPYLDLTRSA